MLVRIRVLYLIFISLLLLIILRLGYWQIVMGSSLRAEARDQYTEKSLQTPARGEILASDGAPLVVNRPVYNLAAYKPQVTESDNKIINQVLPLLEFSIDDPSIATVPALAEIKLKELKIAQESAMTSRLNSKNYSVLARGLSLEQKNKISALDIAGLSFEESFVRSYPEASMSAHVTGFVGRDDLGNPTGYFGLEGFYNRELTGRVGVTQEEKDASGNPLMIGDYRTRSSRAGRSLKLYMDRGAQYLVQEELKKGLERYGAVSGEVVVMDPQSGGILAMVSLPSYDPLKFYAADSVLYKNPSVADSYEPGSTFKVLVMAAALDSGAVKPEDKCDICSGPLPIDKYFIKTWNNEYNENSIPQDILVHSDNVGMVWAQRKMGGETMLKYLDSFGIGSKTGIDLEEEIAPLKRNKWGDIDYATSSFGQGIVVTSIEMVRAVGAIARKGILMEPHVVQSVIGENIVDIKPVEVRRVISEDTAKTLTGMMIAAADHGDAKWTRLPNYTVAGKTGTAQIALAGHYDEEKTIASFVGFVPASNPKFVMLVKLREPKTSQWGSETAAPLWFNIAKKLLLHYNIPPDKE